MIKVTESLQINQISRSSGKVYFLGIFSNTFSSLKNLDILLDTNNIRRFPCQMLSSVHANKLSGQSV